MPQVFTIDSQVPENIEIALSWGKLEETPPNDELVRISAGETFTIQKGHATSIRTKDGWQRGYALADTQVTGPVDISAPSPMSRREFAPQNFIDTSSGQAFFMGILACMGLAILGVTTGVAPFGILAQFGAAIAGSLVSSFSLALVMRSLRKQDEERGLDACAETSKKTFWREDLAWIQTQPIRSASTV